MNSVGAEEFYFIRVKGGHINQWNNTQTEENLRHFQHFQFAILLSANKLFVWANHYFLEHQKSRKVLKFVNFFYRELTTALKLQASPTILRCIEKCAQPV